MLEICESNFVFTNNKSVEKQGRIQRAQIYSRVGDELRSGMNGSKWLYWRKRELPEWGNSSIQCIQGNNVNRRKLTTHTSEM